MSKRVEISTGYTTNTNIVSLGLAEMSAAVNDKGNFEVKVTDRTGSAEEIKTVIESLCPYGKVTIKG